MTYITRIGLDQFTKFDPFQTRNRKESRSPYSFMFSVFVKILRNKDTEAAEMIKNHLECLRENPRRLCDWCLETEYRQAMAATEHLAVFDQVEAECCNACKSKRSVLNNCQVCDLPVCETDAEIDYGGSDSGLGLTQWVCLQCLYPQKYFTGTFERVKEYVARSYRESPQLGAIEGSLALWYFDSLAELFIIERHEFKSVPQPWKETA